MKPFFKKCGRSIGPSQGALRAQTAQQSRARQQSLSREEMQPDFSSVPNGLVVKWRGRGCCSPSAAVPKKWLAPKSVRTKRAAKLNRSLFGAICHSRRQVPPSYRKASFMNGAEIWPIVSAFRTGAVFQMHMALMHVIIPSWHLFSTTSSIRHCTEQRIHMFHCHTTSRRGNTLGIEEFSLNTFLSCPWCSHYPLPRLRNTGFLLFVKSMYPTFGHIIKIHP